MLKWLLIVLGAAIGSVALMALIGLALPPTHTASAALYLREPADSVWAVVRDLGGYAAWWPDIERVERSPRRGREVWLQEDVRGGSLPVAVVESQPPELLVTSISAEGLPFGGTWTYRIEDTPAGCRLTITENAEIYNPLFRFLSRFVFGHHATLESYLKALGTHFGAEAEIERLPA